MELVSLIYVSRGVIPPDDTDSEVAKIVAVAQVHNLGVDITGALLFTGSDFAQVLEGYAPDVDALMESIRRDVRHRDVVVMDRRSIMVRRFPDWSMAYSGPSPFVARFVARLRQATSATAREQAVAWMEELMTAFAE